MHLALTSEITRLEIGNRLTQFLLGVHDKRTAACHRFPQGFATDQQEAAAAFTCSDPDLIALAQLLGSHRIDESGAYVPLDAERLKANFDKLRSN